MLSNEFSKLTTETSGLWSFLEATHTLRTMLPQFQQHSEPSTLELDLFNLSKNAPNSITWRVIEHSLVIGRLYALYENFCENLLGDWIEFLADNYLYKDLPENVKESYPRGLSTIIGMLPSPRYGSLEIKSLVYDYNSALQGAASYSLSPECLVHHKNNLRLSDLREIFSRCGIGGLDGWISESPPLIDYFSGSSARIVDQVSSTLTNLIQYRNDSSHGSVATDEILGFDDLIQQIEFVQALAQALSELISWKAMESMVLSQKARKLGSITEVFRKAKACILKADEIESQVDGIELQVEQDVYVKKAGGFKLNKILSLQIDSRSTPRVVLGAATEIGLQLEQLPEKGSDIYIILPE